jgi:hypothetical protein
VNGSDERGSNGLIVSEHADRELSGIDDSGSCSGIADVCDTDDMSERERKRRERISIANKGKIPWNKGKSHSPGISMKYSSLASLLFCFLLYKSSSWDENGS